MSTIKKTMIQQPYLSICIPTFNRLDILENTLKSIFNDLNNTSLTDFEVIVSDNEPNKSSKAIVDRFKFENLHYVSTDCVGFLNSFYALSYGKGLFLKLHNNYTQLLDGSLESLIDEIKKNQNKKPIIFYTNDMMQSGRIIEFNSYDSFMSRLSYFSSWSTGFGIWKEDFENCYNQVEINKYFPQTSLLLSLPHKSKYIINDKPLFYNQKIKNKGGYNIFKVFSIDFIALISQSYDKNEISHVTFKKIKSDLLLKYLSVRYFKTVMIRIDNFEKDDIKKSILINYSLTSYYLMILVALFSPFLFVIRKFKTITFR